MERVLMDQVVETDYGQFDLVWADDYGFDGDFDRFFAGQLNGLVGASSGEGLYMNLARRSGGSPVRIVLLDDSPALDESWEDVVEVSVSVPAGSDPSWTAWAEMQGGPLDLPPGDYRVRVSAKGRDAGREGEFADGPVDRYLVELWPAPAAPDAIIRAASTDADYWHREVGSRR